MSNLLDAARNVVACLAKGPPGGRAPGRAGDLAAAIRELETQIKALGHEQDLTRVMKAPSLGKTISAEAAAAIDRMSTAPRFALVAWDHRLSTTTLYHVARLLEVDGQAYAFAHLDPPRGLVRFPNKNDALTHLREVAKAAGGTIERTIYREKIGAFHADPVEPID